jgi:hypothetical protein
VSHCTPLGVCDDITGVTNGDKQTYDARAVNAVGDSKAAAQSLAWGYRPPTLPTVTSEAVYQSSTSESEGWVTVTIVDSDSSIKKFAVTATGHSSEVNRAGSGTTETTIKLGVGSRTITVTPISVDDVPTGAGPTAGNSTSTLDVVGQPIITSPGAIGPVDETHLAVAGATFDDRFAGSAAVDLHYIAYRASSGSASCSVDSIGNLNVSVSNGVDALDNAASIGPLTTNKVYNVKICISNGFGIAQMDVGSLRPFTKPETPLGFTYTIAPNGSGAFLISPVAGTAPSSPDFEVKYSNYATTFGSGTSVTAQFCLVDDMSLCGDPGVVDAAVATRAYQILGAGFTQPACVRGVSPTPGINETSGLGSVISFSYTYRLQDGDLFGIPTYATVEVTDGSPVPVEAINITDYSASFVWQSGGGASEYTHIWNPGSVNITCAG